MLCIRGTSHGPVSVCLSVCVCLSVSVSVTSRCSTKTAKRRITQTTPHDTSGSLVLWCQRSPRNSTGVTPYEGAECCRLSETGSRNNWLSVAFNRARVEQVTYVLQLINTSGILFLATLIFPHWLKPFRVCGVGTRKPEVEITDSWWRLIELSRNKS